MENILREIRNFEILGEDQSTWVGGTIGTSPWPVWSAAEIVDRSAPIVYGIVQPGPDIVDGIPYIRGQDLQEGHILTDQLRRTSAEVAARYSRSSLRADDVLLGIIRHTRVAIVPPELDGANITQGTARLRPGSKVSSSYLAHWLSGAAAQGWLKAQMRGIDMPGLNLRDVRRAPIPVPDLATQARISGRLDSVIGEASVLIARLQRLSTELPQLEAELLQAAAYGDLAARSSEAMLGRDSDQAQGLLNEIRSEISKTSDNASSEGRKKRMARSRGNLETVTAAEILAALETSSGAQTPGDLFAKLKLAEAAVDSFYSGLRELAHQHKLQVLRPDSSTVLLELMT
ncbi:restriction endonuclease subunit S [Pseudonocardia xinjiangensis]|uniref:restriction endonuclease subunit S n=1 Tax=Pseudonocardia xinjiangensis TaxID=75289 RepID=UPI003D8EDF77